VTIAAACRRAGVMAALVGLVLLVLASGPLFPFKPHPSDAALAVARAGDLDVSLREREAQHPGVKPGLAKEIAWSDPAARNKTPISLVYLHGFSASRKDISPVVETLAGKLKANVFFTRLAAHGLARPDEFATVSPQDWLDDAREARAIGARIGEHPVLIGTSTGALLATMVALEGGDIGALVLLSPNFALRDWRAKFVSGPVGPLLARLGVGKDYSFRPENALHAEIWTPRFPSQGIVALMNLVNAARCLPMADLRAPTLILYTDKDSVVDVPAIRARYDEIRDRRKRIVDLGSARRHELTGAALAPETVDTVVQQILAFLTAPEVLGPAIRAQAH
jgi:pimeloyl-ACP methyl ester carboxylesterase